MILRSLTNQKGWPSRSLSWTVVAILWMLVKNAKTCNRCSTSLLSVGINWRKPNDIYIIPILNKAQKKIQYASDWKKFLNSYGSRRKQEDESVLWKVSSSCVSTESSEKRAEYKRKFSEKITKFRLICSKKFCRVLMLKRLHVQHFPSFGMFCPPVQPVLALSTLTCQNGQKPTNLIGFGPL